PEYNKGYMTRLGAGYGTEDRYQATAMWMGMTDKSQVSVLGNLNNINAPLFDFNTFGGGARRRSGGGGRPGGGFGNADGLTNVGSRSEEHTSELQSRENLVCRLLLEKKKTKKGEDRKRVERGM